MRYRMNVSITGTRDGADWPPVGGLVDLPPDEGDGMAARGLVSPVEAATLPASETAAIDTHPSARGRKKG
jgi:hypothetical protein